MQRNKQKQNCVVATSTSTATESANGGSEKRVWFSDSDCQHAQQRTETELSGGDEDSRILGLPDSDSRFEWEFFGPVGWLAIHSPWWLFPLLSPNRKSHPISQRIALMSWLSFVKHNQKDRGWNWRATSVERGREKERESAASVSLTVRLYMYLQPALTHSLSLGFCSSFSFAARTALFLAPWNLCQFAVIIIIWNLVILIRILSASGHRKDNRGRWPSTRQGQRVSKRERVRWPYLPLDFSYQNTAMYLWDTQTASSSWGRSQDNRAGTSSHSLCTRLHVDCALYISAYLYISKWRQSRLRCSCRYRYRTRYRYRDGVALFFWLPVVSLSLLRSSVCLFAVGPDQTPPTAPSSDLPPPTPFSPTRRQSGKLRLPYP